MPQDPDTLIPDLTKFQVEAERQRKEVHQRFAGATPDFPPRLQGDELVAWVRAGMRIEQAVAQREAIGLMALQQRRCTPEEWQIDPDGHILPRQTQPSSSGPTPPTETAEPIPHSDH
jgi:hypothetical protein